jgi:hypothetical protein
MTPKEKAEELFNKYYSYLKSNLMDDKEAIDDAKQCALIAVDELITYAHNNYDANYWQEVKQEIEKL